MELAEGGSLRHALDDEALTLSWPLRMRLLLEVAEGMRYLHRADEGRRPIVHRDLKAANVLLDNKNMEHAVSVQGRSSAFGRVWGSVCGQGFTQRAACEQSAAGVSG